MAERDQVLAREQDRREAPLSPKFLFSSHLEGWRLTRVVACVILLSALAIVVWHQGDIEGIRLVIRLTARVSLVLFSLAFTAAALARSLPNVWTRWQRRNRRYLGVSFAFSH